jgi:hypothetical protein
VTSKNFIDCKPNLTRWFGLKKEEECHVDSVRVTGENNGIKNFWYVDTRFLDSENMVFTI